MSIDNEWQKFILDESIEDKTIFTYLQGLKEIISNFKSQLQEIRKYAKRMENQIYTLKEQLVILEESKDIE